MPLLVLELVLFGGEGVGEERGGGGRGERGGGGGERGEVLLALILRCEHQDIH